MYMYGKNIFTVGMRQPNKNRYALTQSH